ncbi:MAG: inositol phosphorylceramide synthase [Bacteroidetes bacterium]|nr:MAG: inositol phosphorylceramide synthase [Bacteroidota bacterium]
MCFQRFTKKNIAVNILLVAAYLFWNIIVEELKPEHYFLILFWLFAYFGNEKSRRFITAFSIFIIYWIIYDSMRIIPNYEVSQVHIKEPYELEKALFGITANNTLLTPNEYFILHNNHFLDFLSGMFYINWVPIPLAFGVYLYLKDKYLFTKFSLVFLFVNIAGFIIYYIYPAAPPWYVELYGFDLQLGVSGNSAGLSRFDKIIGIPVFENIYNKNANVLAAIPSLHAAYPVIVLYYGIKKRLGWVNWLFVIFMLGIWFSAIYSNHHYIIDIILGVIITLITLLLFTTILHNQIVKKLVKKFTKFI